MVADKCSLSWERAFLASFIFFSPSKSKGRVKIPKTIGFLPHDSLIEYYQKAKVYCQLSYRESFGVSLAEAMLCGCVPVVTSKAALPEVVGDTGYYVPYGDPKATSEAITKALNLTREMGGSERIKGLFTLEQRKERLIDIIKGVLG